MKKHKYAFFDIDNTLMDNATNTVPSKLKDALDLLENEGYRLSIATGRNMEAIPEMIKNLYPWFSCITYNGQLIFDQNGNCLRELYIPNQSVEKAMKIAKDTHTTLEIKMINGHFRYNQITEAYQKTYEYFHMDPCPLGEYRSNDKVIAMIASRDLKEDYNDFRQIPNLEVFPSSHYYADINLKGMSKYEGIAFLKKIYDFKEYLAFGDSDNDVEMLKNADISVAMGDSNERIKEECTMVTEKAGENGIYLAVLRLLNMASSN